MQTKNLTLALALVIAISTASFSSVANAKNTPEENAAAGVVGAIILCLFFCGSDDTQDDYSSQSNDNSYYSEYSEQQAPSYHSVPVEPINSFYSDCHSPMEC